MRRRVNARGRLSRLTGGGIAGIVTAVTVLVIGGVVGSATGNGARAAREPAKRGNDPQKAVHQDVSRPLRDIAAHPDPDKAKKTAKEDYPLPLPPLGAPARDTVLQSTAGAAAAPALGSS